MRSSGSRKLLYHANIINLEERLRAVGRFENPLGASINLEGIICSMVEIGLTDLPKFGAGAHCVLKWGFTRTFPGNQDATLK